MDISAEETASAKALGWSLTYQRKVRRGSVAEAQSEVQREGASSQSIQGVMDTLAFLLPVLGSCDRVVGRGMV